MDKKTKNNKKATSAGIIAGSIASVVSYYGVQQLFFKTDVETVLKKAATELNKQLPMNVDEYSRLDSASAEGESCFNYFYTLVDLEKSEVNLDTVNKYIRTGIIENVKNSTELREFRKNKITMNYNYFDKNGVFVTQIAVTPELYSE